MGPGPFAAALEFATGRTAEVSSREGPHLGLEGRGSWRRGGFAASEPHSVCGRPAASILHTAHSTRSACCSRE